jgi:hypothetical protein
LRLDLKLSRRSEAILPFLQDSAGDASTDAFDRMFILPAAALKGE